jgi:hypothetical protein
MKNPVPRDLVGLLAPDSGKWWVVLDCPEVGYLKGLGPNTRLDGTPVLRWIQQRLALENLRRARSGAPPINGVDWAMPPVFDPENYTVEWSLRAETRVDKIVNLQQETETNTVVNHTVRVLGRQRTLGLTIVQPDQPASESVPLRELVKSVSFNPGERYTDHKAGDKPAQLTLEELILGEKRQIAPSPYLWPGIWSGSAALALALIALGVLLIRRKFRRIRMSRAYPAYSEHDHALSRLFVEGHNRASNGARRRRTFNYQKYYADMMLEVSSGPTVLHPTPNGKRAPQVAAPAPASRNDAGVNQTIVLANLDLIANQNHLIDEQKRLLQEQGKLIEEKSKLIQEKTRLLEQQAELFERDLL